MAAPETRIGELPLLTAPERQQLLVDWNSTATNYPRATSAFTNCLKIK